MSGFHLGISVWGGSSWTVWQGDVPPSVRTAKPKILCGENTSLRTSVIFVTKVFGGKLESLGGKLPPSPPLDETLHV